MKLLIFLVLIKFISSQYLEATLTQKDNFIITFTVTNPSPTKTTFLTWGTPFDPMQKNMFTMTETLTKKTALYDDKLVIRSSPLETDYLTVLPFTSTSIDIDLSKLYLFTEKGSYSLTITDLPSVIQLKDAGSSLVTINVSEEKSIIDSLNLLPGQQKQNEKQTIRRINCNIASDNTHIDKGVVGGQREANCSHRCLKNSACDTLYVTWFGTKTTARYSKATVNWGNVADALTKDFSVYCRHKDCTPQYYGWVYPNDAARTIYLCPLYFGSTYYGSMFTHEISHFSAVAGTGDHAYGRSLCRDLARSSPDKAVNNADTYAYFGEDCK